MTDYYPLIARAIAGLEKSTGESRRGLYERARTALVAQLRGLVPPLTESEITRERLGLEEAIRKVEAEAARRPVPRSEQVAAKPSDASRRGEPTRSAATPNPAPLRRDALPGIAAAAGDSRRAVAAETPQARGSSRTRLVGGERQPLTDQGLKGFRDVVAEAETLGEATIQAGKSARQVYAAVPSNAPEFDRVEPRVEPQGLRTPSREAPPRPAEPTPRPFEPREMEPRPTPPQRQMPARHVNRDDDDDFVEPRRSRVGLVAAMFAVLVIIALGITVYWQRVPIKNFFTAMRGQTAAPAQSNSGPAQPKIGDRVGQPSTPNTAPNPGGPVAAVAQHVVLYEEDPADAQGKRYVGSVIWRTEKVSPGAGKPPDIAVRADLEIPERRITMTMSMRRNNDRTLPASHTVEIVFNLPADFPFGGISNVPGILMKQAEQTRGAPLAGLAVKVTSGFFLVGLSAVDSEMQRNMELLRDRGWFDIPIVYNNGRRAILAVEKGTPGDQAFADAFAAWGQ